jgi:oligopeptidase A
MTPINPLLDFSDLPRFDAIRPEHVTPAIDFLLTQASAVVKKLEQNDLVLTWDNFITPLEDATEQLGRAWGIVGHLNGVMDSEELRATYNENQAKITQFWTELGQNLILFQHYKNLEVSPEFKNYSTTRQRIIQNAIRDFKLSGAELDEAKKVRYAEIQEQLAALSTKFSENVLDATNDFSYVTENVSDLSGLPQDVLDAAKHAAEQAGKMGYLFTLHFPSYFPILQYANERTLRELIYRANATKASELHSKTQWDNSPVIQEILQLRREEALLLGYDNYAEVSLVSKMAESPKQVNQFLLDLASKAKDYANIDLNELRSFASEKLNLHDLQAWDITYVSEKLREERYAFSEQEVKNYFPEHKVVSGLFEIIQTLFEIQIKPEITGTWHPDVKFYRIERNGDLIGQFYLDLYARAGKRGGAWMDDARGRRRTITGIQTPVAYLVCNFNAPITVDGIQKPATFSHDEVITLFHEMGHGLHHLLTQVEDLSVSGISGVEWDAVELPSQFMENFCWEWDVLQKLSAHVDNGTALPRTLFEKMIAAKNFQSGMQTLRQVEFALFDMRIHDDFHAQSHLQVQHILDTVRQEISVLTPPDFNRFQHSFSHIFAGGYAAGYFSYKWAEVLSADAYAAFEEAKITEGSAVSRIIGIKFQKEILEMGGSRSALNSFRAFRGRDPSIDALLRHSGMSPTVLEN